MACEYLLLAQKNASNDAKDASVVRTENFVSSTYHCPNPEGCPVSVFAKARNGNVIETGIKEGKVCKETGNKLI